MRGTDGRTEGLFSYVSCEARVPLDHPLRLMRAITDEALAALSGDFAALYARTGRPSIPPEKLLRALLLQAFYTVRSERQLMQQLNYNLLFRWFVGLSMDAPVWDATVFCKNRDRLIAGDVARRFFAAVMSQPRVKGLLSSEHFTVDGTMIEGWASMKSFQNKAPAEGGPDGEGPDGSGGRNAEVDFRGEARGNATHASTTDADVRLYKKGKGQEAKLCFLGHLMMENRHGLVVDTRLSHADGFAERQQALDMIKSRARRGITLGADKAYDTADFVAGLRQLGVTPHVAQNDRNRRSAIDGRTTRHPGYALSQTIRKRIEEAFGWIKTIGGMRKTRHRGLARVGWQFTLTAAACNLVRLSRLLVPA